MKPKKRFGQNFLQEGIHINALLAAAEISTKDSVLEIGPGRGIITEKLAQRAKKVVAVEFDRDLIPLLRKKFKEHNNVEIINADILHFLSSNFQLLTSNFKIVGSLPYQITSPLLHQLMGRRDWTLAALLIQKEVAQKILARPPQATYLSNFVNVWADAKLVTVVPKEAFFPVPKVDGAIVKLRAKNRLARHPELVSGSPRVPKGMLKQVQHDIEPLRWSRFLHRGFAHPRQMLNKVFLIEVLKKAQIDPHRRPATLTLEEWLRVYNLWKN